MIEKAQHAEAVIKAFKNGESKHRQEDFSVVCNDLVRGMGRLVLQVSKTGAATFRYIQKVKGKRSYVVIGNYSKDGRAGITLAEARQKAMTYGALAKQGVCVKDHLLREKQLLEEQEKEDERVARSGTLEQLVNSYLASMRSDGKRTWYRVLAAIEKDVYPVINKEQRAQTISDEQIIEVLATMIDRGAITQSNRVRSYLHAAFNHGLKHDKNPAKKSADVQFSLKTNPVTGIPRQASAERVGNRHLDVHELKKLFTLLDSRAGISQWSANIIKLCIFTGGQRPYELLTLKSRLIDVDNKVAEVSPDYSKNKTSHLVPLTSTSLDLINWFIEYGKLVQPEFLIFQREDVTRHYRADSLSTAVSRFCAANGFEYFCPRDIRRTCKTLMGSIGLSKEVRDRIQNHSFGDTSSKHYDRWEYLPEKREALEKWEEWLLEL